MHDQGSKVTNDSLYSITAIKRAERSFADRTEAFTEPYGSDNALSYSGLQHKIEASAAIPLPCDVLDELTPRFQSAIDAGIGFADSMKANLACQYCYTALRNSWIISGGAAHTSSRQSFEQAHTGRKPLDRREIAHEYYAHHETVYDLCISAMKGCHLCSLLLCALPGSAFPQNSESQAQHRPQSMFKEESPKTSGLVLSLGLSTLRHSPAEIQEEGSIEFGWIDQETKTFSCGNSLQMSRKELESPGYPEFSGSSIPETHFEEVKDSVERCMEHHSVCQKALSSVTSMPKRLLDVRNDQVKLCLSSDITQPEGAHRVSYVTLTHCWGKIKPLRLLQSNIQQFFTVIDFKKLPLTFHQAVLAVRYLGFDYLWIDSLCIIQDSINDWNEESSIMGEIYRGCTLNIAALAATDSQQGLYAPRLPLTHFDCALPGPYFQKVCSKTVHEAIGHQRLLTRGWVMQELILSPQTVYFGYPYYSDECAEHTEGRDSPPQIVYPLRDSSRPSIFRALNTGNTTNDYKSPFYRLLSRQEKTPLVVDLENPSRELTMFHTLWAEHGLLLRYTNSNLTKSTDRLIAIHGIARILQQRTGLTPIAGMWKELIPIELLWIVEKLQPPPEAGYRAPSWSWAAPDGQIGHMWASVAIMLPSHRLRWMLRVVEAQATTLPSGLVTAAHLQIEGVLSPVTTNATWNHVQFWPDYPRPVPRGRDYDSYSDSDDSSFDTSKSDSDSEGSWDNNNNFAATTSTSCGYLEQVKKPISKPEVREYKMPVLMVTNSEGGGKIYGLALERVVGRENVYRRFGLYRERCIIGDRHGEINAQSGIKAIITIE